MSDAKIPLGAGLVAVLVVGFNEGIAWIITPVVVAGVLALGLLLLGGRLSRTVTYPFHNHTGHSDSHVRRHEQGHYNVARRLGARARIELDNPEGPVTRVWADHLSPIEQAAICYGGWAKAGSSGIDGDMKIAKEVLRGQGWGAHREAKRIAKRLA